MKSKHLLPTLAILALGCSQPTTPSAHPTLSLGLDKASAVQRLANPEVYDWSSRLVVSAAAQRATRHTLALGAATQVASTGFAGSAASGHVSSPALDVKKHQVFWVTENGWLLRRDLTTNTDAAFPVSAVDGATPTDTFPRTDVTLSKDGKRVYLCSAEGNFFALDSQTGKNLINSPFPMGGADPAAGAVPAPCVDELAGTLTGNVESVYAVTNMGTLFRYYVDGSGVNAPPYLVKAQTYALGCAMPSTDWGPSYTPTYERFTLAPVVSQGQLYLQSLTQPWGALAHSWGRLIAYDTRVRAATLSPVAGQWREYIGGFSGFAGAELNRYSVPATMELDQDLQPLFLYVAGVDTVSVYYVGGDIIEMTGWSQSRLLDMGSSNADSGTTLGGVFVNSSTMPPVTGVAVDAVHQQVYALSCNTLFQVNFNEAYYTKFPDMYATVLEGRYQRFSEGPIPYAKTHLGRTVGCDINHDGIQNVCPPYFDGTSVYVLDNDGQPGSSTHVSLNRFTPGTPGTVPVKNDPATYGTPPVLEEAIDLTALAPDATLAEHGICVDALTSSLLLATNGQLWTIAR